MMDEDQPIGTLKNGGDVVWQCHRTGLLYFLGPPRKNYVGFHSVNLGSANPAETKKKKKKTKRKKSSEITSSTPDS